MAARGSRVESCAVAFVATPACPHEHLFGPNYQRANRLNSTKILRCFPHCCPHHVVRSYCGSPLHIEVTCESTGEDASQLKVFAHFRDSSTPGPQVGDSLSLATLHGSLQSGENTSGEWIGSEPVGPVGSATSLFEINRSRRWYYSWRSTRRNEDRLRSHVLEALVVVADESTGNARVLAVVKSPPFRITSFRRFNHNSPLNRVQPLTALEASLLELATTSPSAIPAEPLIASSLTRVQLPLSNRSPGELGRFETELALLLSAVSSIRLSRVRQLFTRWEEFQVATVSARVAATDDTIVSNIALWLCLDRHIHDEYERQAAQASHAFSDLKWLGAIYADWMRWLQAQVDTFLQPTGLSWREIIDLAPLKRLAGDPQHLTPHGFDWENVVARARQHTLNDAKSHRDGGCFNSVETWWATTLNAISVLHDQPIRSTPVTRAEDLPLCASIAFTLQLSSIMLTIDASSTVPTLEIYSVLHDDPTRNQRREATRLVLDGRYRSFNSLPHGESALCAGSLLGGQCFGDYVGIVNAELQRVEVACFSWPTELWRRTEPANGGGAVDGLACRWSWSVPLNLADTETLMVEVEVSTASVAGVWSYGLECESVSTRLGRVEGGWEGAYRVRCTYSRRTSMGTMS